LKNCEDGGGIKSLFFFNIFTTGSLPMIAFIF